MMNNVTSNRALKPNSVVKTEKDSTATAATNNTHTKQSTFPNNVSTMATLVSSLSNLVGSNQTNNAMTSFMSSRNLSPSNINLSNGKGSINMIQPMLLPKPNLTQKQVIQTTPTKTNFNSSSNIIMSPLHGSPTNSWQTGSPLNRKRSRSDFESDNFEAKQRRTPNRCPPEQGGRGKGLRHFSMKVCEKVQLKGVTSYNEVADELVTEFSEQAMPGTDQSYDQKNIRRRVYDALNVLMAMNIITKEKKEIKWVGLPTNSAQECKYLEEEKTERIERIRQKQQQLKELIVQQIAYKNLVERNKKVEKKSGSPQANACIHLPFIIVNTSKKTVIDCSISSDKSEYLFNFDEAFEIHDDIEVLKRMGLSYGLEKGTTSEKDMKAVTSMVPKALESCVRQMANGSFGESELIEKLEKPQGVTSPTQQQPQQEGEPFSLTPSSKQSPAGPSQKVSSRKRRSLPPQSQRASRTWYASQNATNASDYESENEGDEENSGAVVE
jgi:hypothetical protein